MHQILLDGGVQANRRYLTSKSRRAYSDAKSICGRFGGESRRESAFLNNLIKLYWDHHHPASTLTMLRVLGRCEDVIQIK